MYCDIMESYGDANFISEFELHERGPVDIAITMTYWGFTTLATIGLGDYYPISDSERLMGCVLFLFGVLIFSVVNGNF